MADIQSSTSVPHGTPTLIIPSVARSTMKFVPACIATVIFSVGFLAFLSQRGVDGFLLGWLAFVGSITLLAWLDSLTEVFGESGEIVTVCRLFYLAPVWKSKRKITEFNSVIRRVHHAITSHGLPMPGFYDVEICLSITGQDGLKLQSFPVTEDPNDPLSTEWAQKIAAVTKLPLIQEIDLWQPGK
jgi:hypothetical protein